MDEPPPTGWRSQWLCKNDTSTAASLPQSTAAPGAVPVASRAAQCFDRVRAGNFAALGALPDRPDDIEAALLDFALRLVRNLNYNPDTVKLRQYLRIGDALAMVEILLANIRFFLRAYAAEGGRS
jgi:hypothetical protein